MSVGPLVETTRDRYACTETGDAHMGGRSHVEKKQVVLAYREGGRLSLEVKLNGRRGGQVGQE